MKLKNFLDRWSPWRLRKKLAQTEAEFQAAFALCGKQIANFSAARNSVVEAMHWLPNVAEYVQQLEGKRIGYGATFVYVDGGALLADRPIEGLTQQLDPVTSLYGCGYFVAESLDRTVARNIAEALGGVFRDESGSQGGLTTGFKATLFSKHVNEALREFKPMPL